MTWPPLTPPPARATLKTLGKWSRPALGLILGVRPNSPIQTTSVLSSMPVVLQVVDQRGEGRVDLPGELADAVVVLLVGVPAVGADLDERDAGLDEPAGQQAALAERRAAVGVADRLGLLLQVEGAHVGREDHPGGLVVQGAVVLDAVEAADALEAGVLRGGRAGRAGGGSGRWRPSGWVFSGGFSGFWTTNGSMAAPRKPAPIVGPPMLTMCGRSKWLSPSSPATEQPMCGCLSVADGT